MRSAIVRSAHEIAFHTPSFSLTEALRAYTLRRLLCATGRFDGLIEDLSVRFVDLNGPRGGADKLCQLEVRLRWGERLRIEDADGDLYLAIDRAAHRLRRNVARAVARHRTLRTGVSSRRRGTSRLATIEEPSST
jgi:ribosome-associated translation inhibitor RaiA